MLRPTTMPVVEDISAKTRLLGGNAIIFEVTVKLHYSEKWILKRYKKRKYEVIVGDGDDQVSISPSVYERNIKEQIESHCQKQAKVVFGPKG